MDFLLGCCHLRPYQKAYLSIVDRFFFILLLYLLYCNIVLKYFSVFLGTQNGMTAIPGVSWLLSKGTPFDS